MDIASQSVFLGWARMPVCVLTLLNQDENHPCSRLFLLSEFSLNLMHLLSIYCVPGSMLNVRWNRVEIVGAPEPRAQRARIEHL